MKKFRYSLYILLCANALFLSSCGIKPAHVDPPEGVEHDTFPNVYPDINTDPQPGMENKNL